MRFATCGAKLALVKGASAGCRIMGSSRPQHSLWLYLVDDKIFDPQTFRRKLAVERHFFALEHHMRDVIIIHQPSEVLAFLYPLDL